MHKSSHMILDITSIVQNVYPDQSYGLYSTYTNINVKYRIPDKPSLWIIMDVESGLCTDYDGEIMVYVSFVFLCFI